MLATRGLPSSECHAATRPFDQHGTVTPGPTKDVLLQGLADAGTSFERGELAYLAVTSKVELPVRDRFAWELHRRLEDRSLLVAREWRRVDLAVVREGDAVVVIESTALYAFASCVSRGSTNTARRWPVTWRRRPPSHRMPTPTRWCSAHTSSEKSLHN